jgi:hypothetical protein
VPPERRIQPGRFAVGKHRTFVSFGVKLVDAEYTLETLAPLAGAKEGWNWLKRQAFGYRIPEFIRKNYNGIQIKEVIEAIQGILKNEMRPDKKEPPADCMMCATDFSGRIGVVSLVNRQAMLNHVLAKARSPKNWYIYDWVEKGTYNTGRAIELAETEAKSTIFLEDATSIEAWINKGAKRGVAKASGDVGGRRNALHAMGKATRNLNP